MIPSSKPSASDEHPTRELVYKLVDPFNLYADDSGEVFYSVSIGRGNTSHQETYGIRSRSGQLLLRSLYQDTYGRVPNTTGFKEGVDALEALGHRRMVPIGLRTMRYQSGFAVDLVDDQWTRAVVSARGWKLVNSGPIFRRGPGALSLPRPVSGGSLSRLRTFLNVANDQDWSLVLGWLVYALQPCGPYPILVLQGEQGSSKSTVAKVLVSLVDPNSAPLISAPRDDRDLVVVARSRHVLALDNLSSIDAKLKDSLCRLATGSGLVTRKLFSDADVITLQATRPIILNGINDLLLADDLADRAISITLPQIPESARIPESEFWTEFERVRFEVLGALLDAAVNSLAAPPLDADLGIPRMADYATFASAAAPTWGVTRQQWLQHYRDSRQDVIKSGLEASPLAVILGAWIKDQHIWEGTYKDLLDHLNSTIDDATQQAVGWPRHPRGLSNQLRYLLPALRTIGVEIHELGHKKNGRTIRVEYRLSGEHGEHGERSFLLNYEEERRKRECGEYRQRSPRSPSSPSSPPPGSRTSGGGS